MLAPSGACTVETPPRIGLVRSYWWLWPWMARSTGYLSNSGATRRAPRRRRRGCGVVANAQWWKNATMKSMLRVGAELRELAASHALRAAAVAAVRGDLEGEVVGVQADDADVAVDKRVHRRAAAGPVGGRSRRVAWPRNRASAPPVRVVVVERLHVVVAGGEHPRHGRRALLDHAEVLGPDVGVEVVEPRSADLAPLFFTGRPLPLWDRRSRCPPPAGGMRGAERRSARPSRPKGLRCVGCRPACSSCR